MKKNSAPDRPWDVNDLAKNFKSAANHFDLPDWLDGNCTEAGRLATLSIQLEQKILQSYLSSFNLPDALMFLHQHQVFKGFVQDTLTQLKRSRIRERGSENFFLAHCNPARANRSAGAGRSVPPAGIDLRRYPSSACFLCEWNQKWQQRGLQLGYATQIDCEEFFCSCNPFGFGRFHTTISTSSHRQQRWTGKEDVLHVLQCAVELASRLPGWAVLFNGSKAAGASIAEHRHYQVFKIDDAQRPFPLQQAAARKIARHRSGDVVELVGGKDYPMTCFRFSADPATMVGQAAELALEWRSLGSTYSENVVATVEDGGVCLYYIPRDDYSHAAGFSGAIACLEILGEFIFAGEQDIRSLSEGGVDYMWLSDVLRSVAPAAVSFLRRLKDAA